MIRRTRICQESGAAKRTWPHGWRFFRLRDSGVQTRTVPFCWRSFTPVRICTDHFYKLLQSAMARLWPILCTTLWFMFLQALYLDFELVVSSLGRLTWAGSSWWDGLVQVQTCFKAMWFYAAKLLDCYARSILYWHRTNGVPFVDTKIPFDTLAHKVAIVPFDWLCRHGSVSSQHIDVFSKWVVARVPLPLWLRLSRFL